jgi:predicted DNA-binding protein with PD1-like motif
VIFMKASEGSLGRIFFIRLEDGDVLPGCIEDFAARNNVKRGWCLLLGGVGAGEVVVGPRNSVEMPPEIMVLPVDGAHEVAAIGMLAPGEDGRPILHMHGALGRSGQTMTGCLRRGVAVWLYSEAILCEIIGTGATRVMNKKTGFLMLEPNAGQN